MRGLSSIVSFFRNTFNKFNNTGARVRFYDMTLKLLKIAFWRENVMNMPYFTKRYNGRHYAMLLNLYMYTTSGLSIFILYGVISLPDATSCDINGIYDLLDNNMYITSGVPSVQLQMHKQVEKKGPVVALSINCNNIVIAMCFGCYSYNE